jgi:hypothetical protein
MSGRPRQSTLDGDVGNPVYAQDPQFVETQQGLRARFPHEWDTFEHTFLRMAETREEGVTSYEVADALKSAMRAPVRRSLRGCVPGSLVTRGLIVTCSRENAEHPEAKGRKVGRYVVTPEYRVLAWIASGGRNG